MANFSRKLTACSKRLKRGENAEDRISELPHEVLVYILSLMPMKEAARTCILSHRWRKVWTFVPVLNFDGSKTLYDYEKTGHDRNEGKKILDLEKHRYINWVKSVLKSYQGPAIEEFKVRFDLDLQFRCEIDYWIRFALDKNVKRLELDLSNYLDGCQLKCYQFPLLSNGYTMKRLRSPTLGLPSCSSLTALTLKEVNVSGDALQYFVSSCKFLERLSITGSGSLISLNLGSPIFLKYLEIIFCHNIRSVELSACNLVSFRYFGPRISFPFENFPNLVELYLGGSYCRYLIYNIHHFSAFLTQLNKIELNLSQIEEDMDFHDWPVLGHLRQLELKVSGDYDDNLLVLSPLIHASPNLYRLVLKVDWIEPLVKAKVMRVPESPHYQLKEVEIVGFMGLGADTEFITYLVKNAVMLEKITVDPREPDLLGSPWEYEDLKRIKAARIRAERLRKRGFLEDKLVVL
ncbi:hypothetical protein CCACVL1_26377 [Corchorus capsularis]|uniref:F-box domain-containing protein n=1 Tax=Corchorus capsularis TaxID=210143 RepID=A0A1R3GF03_COCAP|nr:hypothetical protein CCACVL1_26377 [Corchorus capsularis]